MLQHHSDFDYQKKKKKQLITFTASMKSFIPYQIQS